MYSSRLLCIWTRVLASIIRKACSQHKAALFTNKPLPGLNNIPSLSFHFQQPEAWTPTLFSHLDLMTYSFWQIYYDLLFVFSSRASPILVASGGHASKQRKQWNLAGVIRMFGNWCIATLDLNQWTPGPQGTVLQWNTNSPFPMFEEG